MAEREATTRHAPEGLILAMACVAQFMVVLDVSIVNIALPSIQHDLSFSHTGVQWVVNAYVLTFAGFLLLGGRAADLFGRRRVYLSGLAIFTVASLGAGFAATSGQMVAVRALQGFGGAILSPATLTIIVTTFRGPRLPRAIGAWSAVAGAGGAVGVLLGGVLVGEINWRWIFFINVPLGVAAGVVALAYLQEMRNRDALVKLDLVGSVLVTASLAALVYGIVSTTSHGWASSFTLSWFVGSVGGLICFVFWELEVASHPLLAFRIFRSRSLSGADAVMLLIGAAFFAMWYFLTFYIQDVLHFGALKTGFAFAPMSLAIIAGAQISSRLIARAGVRPLIFTGTLLAALGFYWMSLLGAHSAYATAVLVPAVACSFAMGLLFTPLTTAATSHVDRADAGLASGVLNTARQVGGSLGLAALATAAASRSAQFAHPATATAETAGYQRAFVISSLIFLAAFAASWVIPREVGRSADAPAASPAGH
jgi:EmrB/QacA subfamily drug resistance transporter